MFLARPLFAAALALSLAACAGDPKVVNEGAAAYNVHWGLKCTDPAKKDPNGSQVWAPVQEFFGKKPEWSFVWFKQQKADGSAGPLVNAKSENCDRPDSAINRPYPQQIPEHSDLPR